MWVAPASRGLRADRECGSAPPPRPRGVCAGCTRRGMCIRRERSTAYQPTYTYNQRMHDIRCAVHGPAPRTDGDIPPYAPPAYLDSCRCRRCGATSPSRGYVGWTPAHRVSRATRVVVVYRVRSRSWGALPAAPARPTRDFRVEACKHDKMAQPRCGGCAACRPTSRDARSCGSHD